VIGPSDEVVSPTLPPFEVMFGVKVMVGFEVDEPPKPLPPAPPKPPAPPAPPVALELPPVPVAALVAVWVWSP